MSKKIKVKLTKALSNYYYEGMRYQPGDVFEIDAKYFNPKVMVHADVAPKGVPPAPPKEIPASAEGIEAATLAVPTEEKAAEEKAKSQQPKKGAKAQ